MNEVRNKPWDNPDVLDKMAKVWLSHMLDGTLIKIGDRIGIQDTNGTYPDATYNALGTIDEDGPIKTEKEWINYYKTDEMNGTDEENEEEYLRLKDLI